VVHCDHEDMILLPDPQQLEPDDRPPREIERAVTLDGGEPRCFRRRRVQRQVAQVRLGERDMGRRRDDLHGMSLADGERGAKRVVTAHYGIQTVGQGTHIQSALQPQGDRQVVSRDAGFEVVEEPDALLSE